MAPLKKRIALEMLSGYKNNQIGNKAFICPTCMGILLVESWFLGSMHLAFCQDISLMPFRHFRTC